MPYYDAPLVRMGPRGRSPVGSDQSRSNWVLFGDRALLWTEDVVSDARLDRWADDAPEHLAVTTRTKLATWLGDRTPGHQQRFDLSIVDALRTPPSGRWPALRPSKTRRQFEVWLGPSGLLWSEAAPVTKNSKTFVDAFTRANGNLTGTTSTDGLFQWLDVDVGTDSLNILGNLIEASVNNGFRTCRADADLDTDDHYAQVQFSGPIAYATAGALGVLVRFTGAAGTAGYGLEVGNTGSNFRRIYRYDTDANVTADATAPPTAGTLRLEVDGSSLTAKIDGATILGPSTNTQFAGQLRTGISGYSVTSGTNLQFDNFEAGDLVSALRFILGTH
jgi:hypothetical protein